MRTLVFALITLFASNSFAQVHKSKKVDPIVKQKIVEAINYNFDACNREDIEDVMDSCADAMPGRDNFRRETLKVFEEKDIHYSLMDVEVIEVNPPFALVRMVQKSHTESRDSDEKVLGYRNQTGLVTQEECVEYLNTLKCENGKWKLHLIVSEMKPYVAPEPKEEKEFDKKESTNMGGCVNGLCKPTPFNMPDILESRGFNPPQR